MYVGFIVLCVFSCRRALDLIVYDVGEIDARRSGNTDGTTDTHYTTRTTRKSIGHDRRLIRIGRKNKGSARAKERNGKTRSREMNGELRPKGRGEINSGTVGLRPRRASRLDYTYLPSCLPAAVGFGEWQ